MSDTPKNPVDLVGDDFCRVCYGKGGVNMREEQSYTGRMQDVFYPCYFCDGTGRQTVKALPANETSESDRARPLPGDAVGPDRSGSRPSPELSLLDLTPKPSPDSESDGSQGGADLPESRAPFSKDDVIAEVLATGRPDHHPDYRQWQLDWARERLLSEKRLTAYTEIVACRVIEQLSRDAAVRDAAKRIKASVKARSWRPSPGVRGLRWCLILSCLAVWALFVGILVAWRMGL